MRILIRCDGGGARGVGHVLRSLSIGREARALGHDVVLAGAFAGDFVQQAVVASGLQVVEVPAVADDPEQAAVDLAALARRLGVDVVHVDDYDLPPSLDLVGGALTSTIEDGEFGARDADVRIDPTLGANLEPAPPGRGLRLRGARFTPIRPEVTELGRRGTDQGSAPAPGTPPRVLVVMGGTDPEGASPWVVAALAETGRELDVTVVALPERAQAVHDAAGRLPVTVIDPTPQLPRLMADSDLVVSASGTSVWELCTLGAPMALVLAVDNQRPGYERMLASEAAVGLGTVAELKDTAAVAALLSPLLGDPNLRAALGAAASRLVDGRGAWRIVGAWEALLALRDERAAASTLSGLDVRAATLADAEVLHAWRNDPQTRAASRTHDPVPWEDHLRWLESSLGRDDRRLFVASDADGDVGTVRWDREGDGEWEVSITVAPSRRGQGLARPLLAAGERALADRSGGRELTAYLAVVHEENDASLRLFAAAGYLPELPSDAGGYRRYLKPAGNLTPDLVN